MELIQIFVIFMITTSITLTGFVIRQRKNNRMLGELVDQNKVSDHGRYSKLNVGIKNQEFVTRCPSCAEWINLEAKICKSCQQSVQDHNEAKREGMQLLDQERKEMQIATERKNKEQMQKDKEQLKSILRNKFSRISIASTLLVILLFTILNIASTVRLKKAMPVSTTALVTSWNAIITECGFLGVSTMPKPQTFDSVAIGHSSKLGVELIVETPSTLATFDWDSLLGKEIICFSEKALGLDVSKKFGLESKTIYLENDFSIYYSDPYFLVDKPFIRFRWR